MWQFYVILGISLIMTIMTYFYPYKPKSIIEKEKKASIITLIFIYIVRFIHYCTFTFSIIYIFLFGMEYDIYYLCYGILLWFHWKYFNNECLLSLWEKQLLDKKYNAGDKPKQHPFIDAISHDLNRFLVMLMYCSMYIVIIRNIIVYSLKYINA